MNFVDQEEKRDDGVLLMAYNNADLGGSSTWYMDMGASNHMCGRN